MWRRVKPHRQCWRIATAPIRGGLGITGKFGGTAKGPTIRGAVTRSVTEGFCRSPIDISPSIAYNINAKLRICDRGFTSKEQSRNAPGIAVPRAFFYAGGRAHPLSLAFARQLPRGGEPTHLQGKQELWAGFWTVNAAEGRDAIGSPFGRAGKAGRL